MPRFTVTGEDLEKYLAEASELTLAGEYGKGYHREVRYHVPTAEYRVYDHHELNVATTDATAAATEFNGIRPQRD
jgi:hypothetical protein